MEEDLSIDFQTFSRDLNELLIAIGHLLDREWKPAYATIDSAKQVFQAKFGVSVTTYHAILSLCSETPDLPIRKLLPLATAPLVRNLFEELISTIFMLHDVRASMRLLMRAGYREKADELAHYEKYAAVGEKWKAYIEEIENRMKAEVIELGLSSQEATDPRNTISKWPTPNELLRRMEKDFPNSPDLNFVEYVNSWLYRTLSGDSHLNLKGLVDRGVYYAPKVAEEKFGEDYKNILNERLEDYRTRMMWTTITLILAIASEIEAHFKFGRKDKALHLWRLFEGVSEISEEFFQFRYSDLLSK